MQTYVDETPVVKSTPRSLNKDEEVNKNVQWKDGELRPTRLAGRPLKDIEPVEISKRNSIAVFNKLMAKQEKFMENLDYFLNHKNDKIRLEVTLFGLSNILPSRKSLEGETRNAPITVNFVKAGYIPPNSDVTPSMGSDERPTQIQSISLASESEEDDNGDNGGNEAGNIEEGSILAPVSNVRRS